MMSNRTSSMLDNFLMAVGSLMFLLILFQGYKLIFLDSKGESWKIIPGSSDANLWIDANSVRKDGEFVIIKVKIVPTADFIEYARTSFPSKAYLVWADSLIRIDCNGRKSQFINITKYYSDKTRINIPEEPLEIITPNTPGESTMEYACQTSTGRLIDRMTSKFSRKSST
ncbi:MAG: hypothetical protein GXC76_15375 [Rhodanobacteraceae bacterium]|jgi:hypothetical protein|nr:hypothetical protein [Rhodanobacteraceae bacterium]